MLDVENNLCVLQLNTPHPLSYIIARHNADLGWASMHGGYDQGIHGYKMGILQRHLTIKAEKRRGLLRGSHCSFPINMVLPHWIFHCSKGSHITCNAQKSLENFIFSNIKNFLSKNQVRLGYICIESCAICFFEQSAQFAYIPTPPGYKPVNLSACCRKQRFVKIHDNQWINPIWCHVFVDAQTESDSWNNLLKCVTTNKLRLVPQWGDLSSGRNPLPSSRIGDFCP